VELNEKVNLEGPLRHRNGVGGAGICSQLCLYHPMLQVIWRRVLSSRNLGSSFCWGRCTRGVERRSPCVRYSFLFLYPTNLVLECLV
jgi:hypothetical protein